MLATVTVFVGSYLIASLLFCSASSFLSAVVSLRLSLVNGGSRFDLDCGGREVESDFGFVTFIYTSFWLLNIGSSWSSFSLRGGLFSSVNGAAVGTVVFFWSVLSNDLFLSMRGSSRKWNSLKYICSLWGSTVSSFAFGMPFLASCSYAFLRTSLRSTLYCRNYSFVSSSALLSLIAIFCCSRKINLLFCISSFVYTSKSALSSWR